MEGLTVIPSVICLLPLLICFQHNKRYYNLSKPDHVDIQVISEHTIIFSKFKFFNWRVIALCTYNYLM